MREVMTVKLQNALIALGSVSDTNEARQVPHVRTYVRAYTLYRIS